VALATAPHDRHGVAQGGNHGASIRPDAHCIQDGDIGLWEQAQWWIQGATTDLMGWLNIEDLIYLPKG
jgi:hypothetical protein